ncbi:GGDEF domain-containing protein [Neptuniibacter sp.]|uniref:GGDEF domain-containing protein n=1 Tax=Neptuniibacter sp. TaxID=1962643 RepID=UPI002633B55E|nr:GGDEF domain-containing protein [Neptuniibacter sp.]MCP4596549.1 GGDEF domain-containing protein [Neptuniibacter sp.]
MAEQQADWKNKYRELSVEMEQLEQKTADVETELRQLTSYMSVALQGDSPQLDSAIATLKPLLQEPCGEHIGFLRKLGRQVEDHVRGREEQRSKQAKQTVFALLKWIRMLRTQVENSGSQNILDSLEKRSNEIEEKLYELPALLGDLIEMQSHIESDPSGSPAISDSDFSLDATASTDALGEEVRLLLKRVGAELLELISGLYVPKDAAPNARELVKRIETGFELPHLPEVVHQVVQLVIKSTSNTSEDFENYLIELSSRLTEVQTFVVDSKQEQEEIGKNQRDLDMQVRSDVKKLHHTVKNTHDITDLKKAVSLQLSGLVKAMDSFKRKEEEREIRLQGRYEDLIGKVEEMELETRKVKAHMEEERLRARTDPLTGLPNRAAYDEHMAQEYERWSRYRTSFAVVVADLDLFKRINDNYGHLAGDKVLRLVAKVITKNIRVTDFVARYGGEEFVIILPSTGAEEAAQAMDKLRESLAGSPFNFHGKPVGITMSFGVAEIVEGDSIDDVFARADQALYKAKEDGRNRVCTL